MLVLSALLMAPLAVAQVAISDDGEQIQLNADGTWVRLSRDRFATDDQGRRIRLRPDGTWNVVQANTDAVPARQPATTALLDEPQVLMTSAEIWRRTIKRPKADHAEIRMRFELRVNNVTSANLAIPEDLDNRLSVQTNRGGDYPVLSVAASQRQLAPGEETTLVVWAQGAPRWFGTKYLSVVLSANALGNSVARVVSKNMDEVIRREVQSF